MKNELTIENLKFVAGSMGNTKEKMITKLNVIRNHHELQIECRRIMEAFHNDVIISLRVLNGLSILDSSFLDAGELNYDFLFPFKSILWKGEMKSMDIKSTTYKGRFISNMLMYIDNNLDELIEEMMKYEKTNSERSFIHLMYQIRDCISNFIVKFADNKGDYLNELSAICKLVSLIESEKSEKAFDVYSRELGRMIELVHPTMLLGTKTPDDVIIQNMCLLSYVMITGSPSVKNTLSVPENISLKDEDGIKIVIEVLGDVILKKKESYGFKYSEGYRWFLHSLPKISYKYKDINFNPSLLEGCRALSYLSFYSGDRRIQKIISKMIY